MRISAMSFPTDPLQQGFDTASIRWPLILSRSRRFLRGLIALLAVLPLLYVWACGVQDEQPIGWQSPVDVHPSCTEYSFNQDSYEFCIVQLAESFESAEEVERYCPQSRELEIDCRYNWVSSYKYFDLSLSSLLKACGESVDCRFEVLEHRSKADTEEQIALCEEQVFLQHYREDCIERALMRWWVKMPNENQVSRLLLIETGASDLVAQYAAASVVCRGIGSCEGEGEMFRICSEKVSLFKTREEGCPSNKVPTPWVWSQLNNRMHNVRAKTEGQVLLNGDGKRRMHAEKSGGFKPPKKQNIGRDRSSYPPAPGNRGIK
jgi:hypothetical protein